LEYSKDDTKLNPLQHLFEIKTWGTKWKRVINKTDEWAAWRWANAKIDKENLSLLKQIVHISKENMEDYNLAMFTRAIDFFKEHMNLKDMILEHFFTKLTEQFINIRLGNPLQLAINKIHETQKTILCNSRQAGLGATRTKEQSLKPSSEPSNDRVDLKTIKSVQ